MHRSPLKFQPIYKERLWGGEKLKTSLGKNYSEDGVGESWEQLHFIFFNKGLKNGMGPNTGFQGMGYLAFFWFCFFHVNLQTLLGLGFFGKFQR